LKNTNKQKQQKRKAKIQKISKQLFEIDRDTKKLLNQPPDDKFSFELDLKM
jgi:Tfp pilus assembly protein PilO